MYGIYEAVYYASWKIDDLRIDDYVFRAACDGDVSSQNRIMTQYKSKIRKKYGEDNPRRPQYINWNDQHFDIKRLRDARVPNTRRPAGTTLSPRLSQGTCDCECTQCDIGYHCHSSRRDCSLRP